jgi:hypothetical protein
MFPKFVFLSTFCVSEVMNRQLKGMLTKNNFFLTLALASTRGSEFDPLFFLLDSSCRQRPTACSGVALKQFQSRKQKVFEPFSSRNFASTY